MIAKNEVAHMSCGFCTAVTKITPNIFLIYITPKTTFEINSSSGSQEFWDENFLYHKIWSWYWTATIMNKIDKSFVVQIIVTKVKWTDGWTIWQ